MTEDQKLINRELSNTRIIVENVLCHLKHFRILAERFRHDLDIYDDVFRTVASVVNVRTQKRLAMPST